MLFPSRDKSCKNIHSYAYFSRFNSFEYDGVKQSQTQSPLKMDLPYILGRAIMRGDLERVRDLIEEQPRLLRQVLSSAWVLN